MRYQHHIGIDYSGAGTRDTRLPGLRIFESDLGLGAKEWRDKGKNWSRRSLYDALLDFLTRHPATIVGVDHGFSLPRGQIEAQGLPLDWRSRMAQFAKAWPSDQAGITLRSLRERQRNSPWMGSAKLRRLTEIKVQAKSIFHFDVPGSVAHSTFTGLPWLMHLKNALNDRLHVWPFDGLRPKDGQHVLVEAYPALYSHRYPKEDRTQDQHDAYSVARYLHDQDKAGQLCSLLAPPFSPDEAIFIDLEGWILGAETASGVPRSNPQSDPRRAQKPGFHRSKGQAPPRRP